MTGIDDREAPLLSEVRYEDLVVGRRYGPYAEPVLAHFADRLRDDVGVPRPGAFAGPGVFPVLFLRVLRRAMGGIPPGSVLAKQDLEFHAPVAIDSTVQCEAWVGETYVRRRRPYAVIEFEIRTAEGELALRGRKVIVWPRQEAAA
jgi:hypothetical protein